MSLWEKQQVTLKLSGDLEEFVIPSEMHYLVSGVDYIYQESSSGEVKLVGGNLVESVSQGKVVFKDEELSVPVLFSGLQGVLSLLRSQYDYSVACIRSGGSIIRSNFVGATPKMYTIDITPWEVGRVDGDDSSVEDTELMQE